MKEIYTYTATSANQENLYTAFDLYSVNWFGDGMKQNFLTMWEDRMSKLKGTVAMWIKVEVLERCLKRSQDMKFKRLQYEEKYREDLDEENAPERYVYL